MAKSQAQGGQQVAVVQQAGALQVADLLGRGENELKTVSSFLEQAGEKLEMVASRFIKVDRLIKVGILAVSRSPELFECTRESFLLAMMEAAQAGLEPTGFQGEGYLIPRRNGDLSKALQRATGNSNAIVREAHFQPGYRGLVKVICRSPMIYNVEARAVYQGDEFAFHYGLNPKLEHVPVPPSKRTGKIEAVYAIARFAAEDGKLEDHFDVMWAEDVEHVRQSSQSKNSPAWTGHYEMMARKSVIRREAKQVPTADEAIALAEYDEQIELGHHASLGALSPAYTNLLTERTSAPTQTRTDRVHEQIREELGGSGPTRVQVQGSDLKPSADDSQEEPEDAGDSQAQPEDAGASQPQEEGKADVQMLAAKTAYLKALQPYAEALDAKTIERWEFSITGQPRRSMTTAHYEELAAAIAKGDVPGKE